jgi:hypothetical protein
MSKREFKAGDLIEAVLYLTGVRGRVISVESEGYKIFWVGEQYREQDQFQVHSFEVIEGFYRKAGA